MVLTLKDKPNEEFKKPDNVIAVPVDTLAGGLAVDGLTPRTEYFVKGTEPTTKSMVYQNKDGQDYFVFREDDPISTDGKNRWQEGINAWIEQFHKDDKKYHAPGDILDRKKDEKKEEEKKDESPTATPEPTQTPSPTP
jgi:hypothetical protein